MKVCDLGPFCKQDNHHKLYTNGASNLGIYGQLCPVASRRFSQVLQGLFFLLSIISPIDTNITSTTRCYQVSNKVDNFLSNTGRVSFGLKFLLATELDCWHSGKSHQATLISWMQQQAEEVYSTHCAAIWTQLCSEKFRLLPCFCIPSDSNVFHQNCGTRTIRTSFDVTRD